VIPGYDLVIATMGWNAPDDNRGLDVFARMVLAAVDHPA
jgi:hypothetical protein